MTRAIQSISELCPLPKRVLVLGSTGMVGRSWMEYLTANQIGCQGVSRPEFDLMEPQSITRCFTEHWDLVVNAAAWTDVDGAESDEDGATRANAHAVSEIAQQCAQHGATLITYSTDYVFAGDANTPYPIDAPINPINAYGRSKFRAKALVRQAAKRLPVSIYRPGIVVGDSRTGSIDKIDGPYYAMVLLLKLRSLPGARKLPMIVPREEGIHFHIVPVDYVVGAMVELSALDQAVGKTFHLMDPSPPTFSQFYNQVLGLMGFEGRRISRPMARSIRLVRRRPWPLVRRIFSALGVPAELLVHLAYRVTYDTSEAGRLLLPRHVSCPRYETYVPKLVAFLEQHPGLFGL